jgi:glycolate oxidase FAD binding subunit
VLVAFDGLARTVAWERDEAARRLGAAGARRVEALDGASTGRALEAVRETRRLFASPVAIATAAVLPADAGPYMATAGTTIRAAGLELAAVAQAGQGLVTLVVGPGETPRPAAATAQALAECRAGARARGGHLVVEWAPLGVREACPVWDPPGPAGALMQGLKAELDPQGVLNPGRFVGGI